MEIIRESLHNCRRCRLRDTCQAPVPGHGNPGADIVLIGEAPGAKEDLEGRPFIGRSGTLLTEIMNEAGIARASVYITNLVKCRPPDNRDPDDTESAACYPWLLKELTTVSPRVIITVGRLASYRFLPESPDRFGTIVNTAFSCFNTGQHTVDIYAIYHPAYLLRKRARKPGAPIDRTVQTLQTIKELIT